MSIFKCIQWLLKTVHSLENAQIFKKMNFVVSIINLYISGIYYYLGIIRYCLFTIDISMYISCDK